MSACAVFELSLCMWEAAVRFKCVPKVAISFRVDDLLLEAEDDCPTRLVTKLAAATVGLIAILKTS